MMDHDAMLDDVAVYALGALPAKDAAAVADHLRTCERCRAEYDLLRPAVTAVGYSAQACVDGATGTIASPLLKARIMKEVRATSPARRAPAWLTYAAAACLVLFLGAGLADLRLFGRMSAQQAQLAAQTQTIADLAAADSRHYPFAGGQVLVHGSRLYLAMRALPAPPPGKVYQAWTLPKGSKRMSPSVTFQPGSGGDAILQLPEAATGVVAVAVSVEPAGGSLQPTSKPVAVVAL